MRIVADENFPKRIIDVLRTDGHDVLWARTERPGCTDTELLEFAEAEARLILTLDKDFWQIAIQRRIPLAASGVVLFRVHPATVDNIGPLVRVFTGTERAWAGHISIIGDDGIQMIPARSGRTGGS